MRKLTKVFLAVLGLSALITLLWAAAARIDDPSISFNFFWVLSWLLFLAGLFVISVIFSRVLRRLRFSEKIVPSIRCGSFLFLFLVSVYFLNLLWLPSRGEPLSIAANVSLLLFFGAAFLLKKRRPVSF